MTNPALPAPIPVAAASPVFSLITGPMRPGAVLGVFSSALLVATETPDGPRVVSLLTAEASGVPNGLRLSTSSADRPFAGYSAGDAAFVGGGALALTGRRFVPVRAWRTAVPRIRPEASALAALVAAAGTWTLGLPLAPLHALQESLSSGDAAALREAIDGLVGLGNGLTPGGDDVLAGLLVALHATGRAVLCQQISVAALELVDQRTTTLSADLLRLAAAGHASTEALAVIAALHRGRNLAPALARLLAVGHTSGADLATGLALGFTAPHTCLPVSSTPPVSTHRSRTADRAGRKAGR